MARLTLPISFAAANYWPRVQFPVMDAQGTPLLALKEPSASGAARATDQGVHKPAGPASPEGGVGDGPVGQPAEVTVLGVVHAPPPEAMQMADHGRDGDTKRLRG